MSALIAVQRCKAQVNCRRAAHVLSAYIFNSVRRACKGPHATNHFHEVKRTIFGFGARKSGIHICVRPGLHKCADLGREWEGGTSQKRFTLQTQITKTASAIVRYLPRI